ncbi:MAG: tRNA lysidine(34) synthetase TilS [Corallococcus sp.]|nr:tRNA lysidine(34) synthetase TilS [Corallococcus sp.]
MYTVRMFELDLSKKYILAVSGGSDSMAMLGMFAKRRGEIDFSVVTVNHGLRQNGASDAEFVQNYCKSVGVDCVRYDLDVREYCKISGVSEESGARILRYEIFGRLHCDYVCLAHNKDDNAESILMHLLRGSGASGAAGIKRVNGRYLRPLLDYTKRQLEDYCLSNGIPFVVDETNADLDYMRNYVRHEILPRLSKVNAGATDNLLRFAENIGEDDVYLNSLADDGNVRYGSNCADIPVELLKQPLPIAYRLLKKVFVKLGYSCDIEKTHMEALINLANNGGGKRISLPFDLVAVNDYDRLSVFKNTDEVYCDFEKPFALGVTQTPEGKLVVTNNKPEVCCLRLDASQIPSDAVVRHPKQGDVFTKFGGGTKPLNRYFIDKKIPRRQRGRLVVVAKDNVVYVICGVEIADAVKIGKTSQPTYIYIDKE